MAHPQLPRWLTNAVRNADPRRSLVVGAMWLIIALALAFSIAATVWVGRIARDNVLEQHVRRLALETDQLSSDLGQALGARLDAVRAAQRLLLADHQNPARGMREVFDELRFAYPQFSWLTAADADGRLVGTGGAPPATADVAAQPWFAGGLRGVWLGVISPAPAAPDSATLGDMAAPVRDAAGRVVGVVAARLRWPRAAQHPLRLTDESDPHGSTQAYVLDRDGVVLIGPAAARDKPWNGTPIEARAAAGAPQFERLPDGKRVLVARAPLEPGAQPPGRGWLVQLSEPNERVYQRANAVTLQIFWVSLCLGSVTALVGVLGTRKLTRRLKRLTGSVAAIGQSDAEPIEIPAGDDEVARLARAFAKILGDLQEERRELKSLSSELERRVAVRTREVQRLAEESRYAAIVRERLKMARDLHDTLAHSMMALLSEIRFLRRLQTRDPAAVPDELARAEQIAHEGLREARSAITQMRINAVRETGLGPALSSEFERFLNRTGLAGEFEADPESARFGDERAEALLRMAQEALRNVERHAVATRVAVTLRSVGGTHLELQIADNGVGFDPTAHQPGHFGLVGLREQADLIGAELRIESGAGTGTRLHITLPLAPMAFGRRETAATP
jgi:signal transduction histidine kinase